MLGGKGMVEQTGCPSPRVPRDQQRPSVLGRQLGRVAALSMGKMGEEQGWLVSRARIGHCGMAARLPKMAASLAEGGPQGSVALENGVARVSEHSCRLKPSLRVSSRARINGDTGGRGRW